MNWVEETGTVVAVDGGKASVKLDRKARKECGSCCACGAFAAGEDTIKVPAGQLKQGERVSIRIPQVNAYLSMFLVFGLPMLLFFAGIFVGRALEQTERIGTGALVGGVLGLFIAFFIAAVVDRAFRRKAQPEVCGPAAGAPRDDA